MVKPPFKLRRGQITRTRNLALNNALTWLNSCESDDLRSSSPLKTTKPSVQGTLGFDQQIERPPFHKPYLVTLTDKTARCHHSWLVTFSSFELDHSKSRCEAKAVTGLMQRCHQCNRPFGLVRHRFAFNRFCSKACLQKHKVNTNLTLSRLKDWADFLARKPPGRNRA